MTRTSLHRAIDYGSLIHRDCDAGLLVFAKAALFGADFVDPDRQCWNPIPAFGIGDREPHRICVGTPNCYRDSGHYRFTRRGIMLSRGTSRI
jgi:hypothetical protein